MDKKTLSAIIVVIILIVASVSAYTLINNKKGDETVSTFDEAELKVYGNVNGDRFLDADDAKIIENLVKDGKTAEDYPLADANQDGKLTSEDVDVVNAVVAGKSTTLYHISYTDADQNGVMDTKIVSTAFPIKSAIMTGSTNTAILMYCLGIVDQVKGRPTPVRRSTRICSQSRTWTPPSASNSDPLPARSRSRTARPDPQTSSRNRT